MQDNEYVVFNENQQKLRYILAISYTYVKADNKYLSVIKYMKWLLSRYLVEFNIKSDPTVKADIGNPEYLKEQVVPAQLFLNNPGKH